MRITWTHDLDAAELANHLAAHTTEDEIYEFVTAIDAAGASWNLTERLHTYFAEQMTHLAAEKALDDAEAAL